MTTDRCWVSSCPDSGEYEVTFDTNHTYRYCGKHGWPFYRDYSRSIQRVQLVKKGRSVVFGQEEDPWDF